MGRLILASSEPNDILTLLPLPAKVGIAAFVVLLVAFIVGVCVMYKRKSKEKDRVYRDMQNKMDLLEAKVAKECKEGVNTLNI